MRWWPTGRHLLTTLAAPLVLATALTGLAPAGASAAPCQTRAAGQPVTPPGAGSDLKSVAVLSACSAWTVGFFSDNQANEVTLAEHWDGTAWTVVPTPNPPGSDFNRLNSIRAVSAHDIWAAGSAFPGTGRRALTERYDGTAWTLVTAPAPGSSSVLNSVRPVSANDAWAVGGYQASGRSKVLILHWNGTAWQQMRGLNPEFGNALSSVAATSSHDVWAVGAAFPRGDHGSSALILHWDGHRWRRSASPQPGSGRQLLAVGASSAANAWAVGIYDTSAGDEVPLLLHWNGIRWAKFTGPRGLSGLLTGVYVISKTDAWAAGTAGGNSDQALLLHWDGSRWTRVSRPVPGAESRLLAIAASSAKNIWAVGDFTTPDNRSGLLGVHCC